MNGILKTRVRCFLMIFAVAMVAHQCPAYVTAEVSFEVTDLGNGRWEYEYTVANTGNTNAIEEFTIWFDETLYENLAITTQAPLSDKWSELVIQPEPWISVDGFYDALTLEDGILPGTSESEFTIRFDWLGEGIPGIQSFDIVNPISFSTIYSGTTIPEPASLTLLALGGLAVFRRR